MKKFTIIPWLIAFGVAAGAFGETADTVLFDFLDIEPGVRPGGIGKTFTGLADDANAAYYNPGGLALQDRSSLTVMHEPRGTGKLDDLFFDYLAFSYRMRRYGAVAAAVAYHNTGGSEIYDEAGNSLGMMHIYHIAPSAYWSYPLRPDLGIGAGVTYAYEHLSDLPGGINEQLLFNAGILYRTPVKRLRAGVAFTNVGANSAGSRLDVTTHRQYDATWPPPRKLRVGFSYGVVSDELNELALAVDGSKLLINLKDPLGVELGEAVYSGGAEYVYAKMVAVRAGYYSDKIGEIRGLTLGFGFTYRGLSFDYARVPEGSLFEDRHRFAISYRF